MVPLKTKHALPGQRLKTLRATMGITTREVEYFSSQIARAEGKSQYHISHSALTVIENSSLTPSIYKLYSLSVIYRINYEDLLLTFGVDLGGITKAQLAVSIPKTHLLPSKVYYPEQRVSFPVRFDPDVRMTETSLLSQMVQTWGEIPIRFIQDLGIRKYLYGYIGLEDYTMYPLLRPGSFVRIDDQDAKIRSETWENEFERPIYFLQFRDGNACGWCELEAGALSLVPHSLSEQPLRTYSYPGDVDIVGRVIGIAMPLEKPEARSLPTRRRGGRLIGDQSES